MMQTVRVHLFARFRDVFNAEVLDLLLPINADVKLLRERIAVANPGLAALLSRSQIAVNDEFVDDDVPIRAGDEIAIIPPVSGG